MINKLNPIKDIWFSKKVTKFVGRTQGEFGLIKPGDRILVGFSGGKDSFVLLHTLKRMQLIAPFDFELSAIVIDSGTGIDYSALKTHCEKFDIDFIWYKTPILEIIEEKKRPGSSACGFCARMRRGALYTKALELGFNKIALGHHFDDAVETFFMSMFYNGIMRSMPPKYKAYNGIEVIRPLIKVREKWIEYMAKKNNFPIINGEESCLAYSASDGKEPYAREKVKKFLENLEKDEPKIFQRLDNAFSHIDCDTFFMKEFNETSKLGS